MSAKRFSIRFSQLGGLVMFASLFIWSSVVLAGCDDVVPNGLIACYPFNGDAKDATGSNNNGVVNGAVLTTDRFNNPNSAYSFDGIKSFIEVKDSAALRLNNTDFTLAAWVLEKARNSSYQDAILVKRGGGEQDGWLFSLLGKYSNFGVGNLFYNVSGGSDPRLQSATVIPLNSWHHVVFTYVNGQKIGKMYVDGVFSGQTTLPSPNGTTSNNLFIGKDSVNLVNGYYFNGIIDDIRIYNRSLSEAEIMQLYNEPNYSCLSATYTNGVLQVPFIQIEGVTDIYKATLQQYSSSFAFQVTQSTIVTGKKSSCPATYSTKTGIGVLHIPLVKTKTTLPPNTPQCYDVTLQEFSNRFQLDLEQVKLIPCP